METAKRPAAPDSGTDTPSFEELAADPEIAALLDFEPVPRQLQKANGWTAPMQRMFIAWLAFYGSAGKAAEELGKARSGIDKVYKTPGADSFRAAWDGAVALAQRRLTERVASARSGAGAMRAPFVNRSSPSLPGSNPGVSDHSGEVMNEFGEWEDEHGYQRRVEEARDSICEKLVRCRRAFLQEISTSPGMRAAFEILTELPVDWDLAADLKPQPFEPWTRTNQRQYDMVLTAESGWSFGEHGYGPDKKAQLRAAIDRHRDEEGLPPVDWDCESAAEPGPPTETERREGSPIDVTSGLPRVTDSSEEEPVRWTAPNGTTHTSPPGTMRTLPMDSEEFHEAVTCPSRKGSLLPGTPFVRAGPVVIVEPRKD